MRIISAHKVRTLHRCSQLPLPSYRDGANIDVCLLGLLVSSSSKISYKLLNSFVFLLLFEADVICTIIQREHYCVRYTLLRSVSVVHLPYHSATVPCGEKEICLVCTVYTCVRTQQHSAAAYALRICTENRTCFLLAPAITFE